MSTTATCECGNEIRADDRETLVFKFLEHCDRDHSEWQASEQVVRNYLEALDRLTGPTERLPELGAVEVGAVRDGDIENVLRFFDHDVFADNPGWASCYCMFHSVEHSTWGERSATQNRADLAGGLRSGVITATIASVDGRVAGWCNASRRRAYPAHRDGSPDDDRVGAIVCFAVAPPYRAHGIARTLVGATVERLRDDGATAVEAYPVRDPSEASAAYHGTVSMFAAAGFDVVSDDEHGIVMRRTLGHGPFA
jgi:GNAT superfamily N-acetyltransferase